METVGAFEAKTYLPKLLERVSQGEEIVITRHGTPIAKLVPFEKKRDPEKIREAIRQMKEFGKRHSLGGVSLRSLIEEGRR
jgi:prevent-host-death family protein